jgi:hypothetical protein
MPPARPLRIALAGALAPGPAPLPARVAARLGDGLAARGHEVRHAAPQSGAHGDFITGLRAWWREWRPDLVHVEFPSQFAAQAVEAARREGIPVGARAGAVATSDVVVEHPRGIDLRRFHPRYRDARLRAAWGARAGQRILLLLAPPDETLIATLAGEAAPLVVVRGDAVLRERLRAALTQVTVIGEPEPEDLAATFASADAVLHAADAVDEVREQAREAMACATPVLAPAELEALQGGELAARGVAAREALAACDWPRCAAAYERAFATVVGA